ncbi:MAG: FHA domain-containing protein [Planctomycetes bacterium]|nr:FHA domain-containing protein [Planctomycetota bacterium]
MFPDGITLRELVDRAEHMDLKAVVGATPLLVFRPDRHGESLLFVTPADEQVSSTFLTDTGALATTEGGAQGFAIPDAVVVALTKSNRNPEADDTVIRVGRARTNDIRLRSVNVSKVHVSLEPSEGVGSLPSWQIVDHNSANGTWVNGLQLQPEEPNFLRPSDELRIADVSAVFLDADGLQSLLAGVRRAL